jgi:PAS domain S-box-containing protein
MEPGGVVQQFANQSRVRLRGDRAWRGFAPHAKGVAMKLSTRMALAMVALVLLTAAALGLLTYRNIVTLILPRALDRMETHARLTAKVLEASLRGARTDAIGFQASIGVHNLMTAHLGSTPDAMNAAEVESRTRLGLRFAAELASRPEYLRLRVIGVDDGGRELVRVDRSGPGGAIRVLPDAELKRQGDQDYFKNTVALPANEVFVSRVALNGESGVIETPPIPTFRTAAPIAGPDGKPLGIVVINIDLRPAIGTVRDSVSGDSQVYLVNDSGDYLVHPDRSREFGFERGKTDRIQDDFPDLAENLAKPDPQPQLMEDRAGKRFGIGWESLQLAGGPRVTVIEANPYDTLMRAQAVVSRSTLVGGIAAMFCAMLAAVILARSLTRPLVEITKAIDGFSRGESVTVPSSGSLEIDILAAAFTRMMDEARRKAAALNEEVEERRHIDEVLNNTIANMVDPVLVADSQGKIIIANLAARKLFGVGSGVGSRNIARSLDTFHPDGVAPFPIEQTALVRALSGEAVDDLELVVQPRGPSSKSHLVANGRPVRNETGEIQGAVVVYHDVTQNKKTQEALRESEQMARAIIETALDAFIQIDLIGAISEWSPHAEAMFGLSRGEVIGQNLASLIFAPDSREEYRKGYARFIDEASRGGPGHRFEIEAVRKDGVPIQIEVAMTALHRDSGIVTNAFMRDLTDKKASEEQLRQAQKMESIGQLTGGIAHDFNNMLTVITGTIDILADAVADQPQNAAIVKLISQAADRGAALTGHLLAFARKQPLQPHQADVNALLADLKKLLQPTLGEQIEIDTVLQDAIWPTFVDRGQLSSALVNLAVNARDAMPDGGRLTLETCNVVLDCNFANRVGGIEPGNYVMIAVSDTGSGIPEAIRDKVFDPFFTTKEIGKGTGLGLSMVYGFIKQSGGHVTVYSDVGRGTTIRIYLPRSEEEAEPEWISPTTDQSGGGNETILVVEDDAMLRSYVTTQLDSLGYATLTAANAAEALAISDGGAKFDLLFTDITMPGRMNGRQLGVEMAKRRPALKVLFTSGYSEYTAADPDILLLAKPYRKSELARMIRLALASDDMPQPEKRHASL